MIKDFKSIPKQNIDRYDIKTTSSLVTLTGLKKIRKRKKIVIDVYSKV